MLQQLEKCWNFYERNPFHRHSTALWTNSIIIFVILYILTYNVLFYTYNLWNVLLKILNVVEILNMFTLC